MKQFKIIVYYTVYLRESDEIIAYGTAEECSKIMKMNKKTFISTVSKTLKHNRSKYTILKERLSAEEFNS